MECSKKDNLDFCNCTYEPCSKKGICCECIQYHLNINQLPACFFNKETEKTYDRSISHFIRLHKDL
ncbi:MAG TPA: DUF6485 family protein [Nitrospinota bacterium]|nr:DUF6485 family protein [Nitrospinota bacterium]